jgi:hypothetical protein
MPNCKIPIRYFDERLFVAELLMALAAGLIVLATTLLLAPAAAAQAIGAGGCGQTGAMFVAGVESATVDDPSDKWSKGWINLEGGHPIRVPGNMIIDLPANRLTLQQFCANEPDPAVPCMEAHVVTILANRMSPNPPATPIGAPPCPQFFGTDGAPFSGGLIIAGDIWIHKDDQEHQGIVTSIDRTEGSFMLDGSLKVRINDPEAVHSLQTGAECTPTDSTTVDPASDPVGAVLVSKDNCSPDPRYTNDPTNYTFAGTTGFPFCINGDNCDLQNRPTGPAIGSNTSGEIPDALKFAALRVGDHVSTTGATETINGITFQSAHTIVASVAISTAPNTADYITVAEAEMDVPTFANQRLKALNIGFTTGNEDTSLYRALYNGASDAPQNELLQFIGGTQSCEALRFAGTCRGNALLNAAGLGQVIKIRYDWDFIVGASKEYLNPAAMVRHAGDPSHILNYTEQRDALGNIIFDDSGSPILLGSGSNPEDSFNVFSPIGRDVIYTTDAWDRCVAGPGPCFDVFDANGKPAQWGFYLSPNGIGHPEWDEIDLAAAMTPFVFEGEPWNLDRRLGPDGGSEPMVSSNFEKGYALGAFGLDPFPTSGSNPCGLMVDGKSVADTEARGQAVPNNCADRVSLDPITDTLLNTNLGAGFVAPGAKIFDPLAQGAAGLGEETTIGGLPRRAGRRLGRRLGALLEGTAVPCRRDGRQGAEPIPACEVPFGRLVGTLAQLQANAVPPGSISASLVNKSINDIDPNGAIIFQRERFDVTVLNVPASLIFADSTEGLPVTHFVQGIGAFDSIFVDGAKVVFIDTSGLEIVTYTPVTAEAQFFINSSGELAPRQDVVKLSLSLRFDAARNLVPSPGSTATVYLGTDTAMLAQFRLTGDSTVDLATNVVVEDVTPTPNQLVLNIARPIALAAAAALTRANPEDFNPGPVATFEPPVIDFQPGLGEPIQLGGYVGDAGRFSEIFTCPLGLEAVSENRDVACRQGIAQGEWRCRGRRLAPGAFISATCEIPESHVLVGQAPAGPKVFFADQKGRLLGAVGNCAAKETASTTDGRVSCTTFRDGSFRCSGSGFARSEQVTVTCD